MVTPCFCWCVPPGRPVIPGPTHVFIVGCAWLTRKADCCWRQRELIEARERPMDSVVQSLFEVVQSRRVSAPPDSYTAKLFSAGENEIVKKVGEEAIEVIVAAKGEG